MTFQSTRPMRGATRFKHRVELRIEVSIHAPHAGRDDIPDREPRFPRVSIHAPHAGRDSPSFRQDGRYGVSIHAPHAGRDAVCAAERQLIVVSIHAPHAGRDEPQSPVRLPDAVSIHAPHAGRDRDLTICARSAQSFNPRAPCGARPSDSAVGDDMSVFQSTRPMRGATPSTTTRRGRIRVSIHAPHAGRDLDSISYISRPDLFQSTRPMRGATCSASV